MPFDISSSGITLDDGSKIGTFNSLGIRNRIINGDMRIQQRGAVTPIVAAAALAYTVDRWYAYCTGANVTAARVAGTVATEFRYQFTGAASVTKIGFAQRIEATNCIDLAGKTATLSVNLSNSLLTTVTYTVSRATTTADTFGTLASPTVTQIATGTFTVSSTLENYRIAVAIPDAAITGLQIEFSVAAQTSGTFIIGNVQLEIGSVATPFERRPLSVELALCQRYYQRIEGDAAYPRVRAYGLASGVHVTTFAFPVIMRVSPTSLALSGTWTVANCSQPTAVDANVYGYDLRATVTATGMYDFYPSSSDDNVAYNSEL